MKIDLLNLLNKLLRVYDMNLKYTMHSNICIVGIWDHRHFNVSYSCRNLWLGVDLRYCGTESSQKRTTNHTFWIPISDLPETAHLLRWLPIGSPPQDENVLDLAWSNTKINDFYVNSRFEGMNSVFAGMNFIFAGIFLMFWGMNLHVCKYEFLGFSRLQVWNSIPYTWLSQAWLLGSSYNTTVFPLDVLPFPSQGTRLWLYHWWITLLHKKIHWTINN